MSQSIEAQGTVFEIGVGTPVVYKGVCVKTFSGPGGAATVIDTTTLCSTAKEKRMGLRDEGTLSVVLNFVPSDEGHEALRAARASRALTPFRLTFTDTPATVWTFNGYVTTFSVSGAVDGVVEANVDIEITGAITES
jgi:hypothetical protein